ncbi:MAG: FliH/SctL family protein [Armatimonadetes bacterium]|nr:FliH/SctL family protein [Armatimonadota bacterium]
MVTRSWSNALNATRWLRFYGKKMTPFTDLSSSEAVPGINDAEPKPLQFHDVTKIAEAERKARIEREGEPLEFALYRLKAADQANLIISEAMTKTHQIEQDARSQGYQLGYEEGYKIGSDKARLAIQAEFDGLRSQYQEALINLLNKIEERRRQIWQEVEPQVVEMVLELTRRVIHQEVQQHSDVVLAIIRGALRRATDRHELVIRVNPDDFPTVDQARQDILAIADGCKHLEIIEDRRVDRGGCVVDTPAGTIDARIQTQMEEFETVINGLMPPTPDKADLPEAA